MHRAFGIAVLVAMFFTPAVGAEAPAKTLPVSLARDVASKTVALHVLYMPASRSSV